MDGEDNVDFDVDVASVCTKFIKMKNLDDIKFHGDMSEPNQIVNYTSDVFIIEHLQDVFW